MNSARCASSSLLEARTRVDPVRAASPPGRLTRASRRPRPNRFTGNSVPSRWERREHLARHLVRWRRAKECKDGKVSDGEFDVLVLGAGSAATPAHSGRPSSGSRSAWSRRTSSAAPACTSAASPPRRCCTRPRSPTSTRESAQFGVRATLDGHRHGRRQRLQGQRRRAALQGPDRADQGSRHHRHRGRGPADRSARGHRGLDRLDRRLGLDRDVHRHARRAGLRLLQPHRCPGSTSTASGCSPPSTRCGSTGCRRRWSCSAAA